MARVAVLPEELVNKIAAGEVVERPASVVKELCENALDAGSRAIRVRLQGGGSRRIEVADDGAGMSREDAERALQRHATSKLRTLEELFEIHTMGFRGEALPAIAAVSRFQLVTSEPGAAEGTRIRAEGGQALRVEVAPPIGGTTVTVEDLFFNTPARRKFLKREETETRHCLEAALRLCLSHPEVAFTVEHEGRALLSAPASPDGLGDRIIAALGREVVGRLLPVDERRLGLRVRGFIASPELSQSTARAVYTFVNRRYVRDRGLNGALQRAFADALAPGRHPLVVLSIEMEPREVDVNVHPQKMEVRFADPTSVQEALVTGVHRALHSPGAPGQPAGPPPLPTPDYASAVDRFLSRAQGALAQWAPPEGAAPAFGQARPDLNTAPPPGFYGRLRPLGTLGGRFWVCEGGGGSLVVVDPHAARERAQLSALAAALEGGNGAGEKSLFSAQVPLRREVAERLVAHGDVLQRLGVVVEPFGAGAVAVRALPPGLERADPADLLDALARALPAAPAAPTADGYRAALRALACRGAAAAPESPLEAERRALFAALDAADFHLPAEHSTIVVLDVPLLELDRKAR
ncbi:MAG TPA: DNA mismatch repair endonuclease MutL [Myxococcales bacterium]|nr:DNA mismatch repair endonuclease MutL [Myxococcales bacterium]